MLKARGIPEDRSDPAHFLTVESDTWHMAHPITCVLSSCLFTETVRAWLRDPDPTIEVGTYRWIGIMDDPVPIKPTRGICERGCGAELANEPHRHDFPIWWVNQ